VCPPGTFNTGPGFDACIPCLAGTSSPGGTARCSTCAPGTYSAKDGASECLQCPTGKFQRDQGQTKCIECDVDSFAESEGSPECTACSSADKTTNGATGSTSELACECRANTYGLPGPGECSPCPRGGVCLPGASVPEVANGFWRAGSNDTQMYPCIPPHACLGSANNGTAGCETGYTGFRCGECLRDVERELKYYRIGDECKPCPSKTGWSMLLIFLLFLIVVGLLLVFGRAGVKVGTLQIGINFLQMLSLFSGFRLKWPPIVLDMLSFLSVFAFNIEVLHPECEVRMDFFDKTFFILSLPFLFFFFFVVIFSVYIVVDKLRFKRAMTKQQLEADSLEFRDAELRRQTSLRRMFFLCCASLTILLSVLYSTLASRSLSFFDCTMQFDGRYMMDASPTDECFSRRWFKFLWIGIFGLVVYVVMWPIVLAVCVHRARVDSRSRNVVMMVLSPLLSNYRTKHLGWELCLIGRKAAVIMSALFFTESALYQAVGGVITLIFALALHSHAKPFSTSINNVTELVSILVSALVLLFGLAIFSGESTETESEHLGYVIVGLVGIAIITLIIGASVEIKDAWHTLRRAVDFAKYTNEENVLCLRRVINPASEGRIRDYLQDTFERGVHEVAHERLWATLQALSAEVMLYHSAKKGARTEVSGGDEASVSHAANRQVQLLEFAKQRVQKHLASTSAIAMFTGGMLQDSAAAAVREWVRGRTAGMESGDAHQDTVNDLLMFVSTFASIELLHFMRERDSKELWHADREIETTRRRNHRELMRLVDAANAGDSSKVRSEDQAAYADEAAVVMELAPLDRAITFMLVPRLYGTFGTSWLEAMPSITRGEDGVGRRLTALESLPQLQATIADLHRAYFSQLSLDVSITPAQRFLDALPVKYRRSAKHELGEEVVENDESRAGARMDKESRRAARLASATNKGTGGDKATGKARRNESDADDSGSDNDGAAAAAQAEAGPSIFGINLTNPWGFFSPRDPSSPSEVELSDTGTSAV
jgi:hypothetical protein